MKRYFGMLLMVAAVVIAPVSTGQAADKERNRTSKITLHPAAETHPALKYQLLPSFLDRRPGNAVLHYLKVPQERFILFGDQAFWETIVKWTEMPLPELRTEKKSAAFQKYGGIPLSSNIVDELERGSRCESCDWDIPIREGNPFFVLLPEIQAARGPARILAARARFQIADGKFDEAIRTLQTGYAMGRHLSQGPTMVQTLVGMTIAGMMSKQVETFIQQPGAPNLYWALASLPRPIVDARPAFEAEMAFVYLVCPELRDLDKEHYTPEQWQRLWEQTVKKLRGLIGVLTPVGSAPAATADSKGPQHAAGSESYPRAKRFLVARGRSVAEVDAMPIPQVLLLFTVKTYEELRDDMFKWVLIPYAEGKGKIKEMQRLISQKSRAGAEAEILPLGATLLPAVGSAKTAEARMDRYIAALQILEAIRAYGATHDARLPERLADITEMPIPADPLHGEPFLYRRDGNTAHLESPDPTEPAFAIAVHFQIEMVR